MKVRLYYNGEEKLKRIEIVLRDNFVLRLPPHYYNKSVVYNPISGIPLPLKLFEVIKVYKHKLF